MLMMEAGTKNGLILRGPRFRVRLFDARQATDSGTDNHADPFGILFGDGQTAILHGLDSRRHAVVDEPVHVTRFFRRHVVFDVEAFDFAGETRAERGGVETGNCCDSRFTGKQRFPGFGYRVPDRGHATQSGDDDAS
jgi:hypothetical protein